MPTVTVSGQVEGDVYASAHIALLLLLGEWKYLLLSMEMAKGGQFTGSIRQGVRDGG